MKVVSVAEAKTGLSELLGAVAYRGDSFVIAKRGKPMARLVPMGEATPHLADAQGWLDDDDTFFRDVEALEAARSNDGLRPLPVFD